MRRVLAAKIPSDDVVQIAYSYLGILIPIVPLQYKYHFPCISHCISNSGISHSVRIAMKKHEDSLLWFVTHHRGGLFSKPIKLGQSIYQQIEIQRDQGGHFWDGMLLGTSRGTPQS